ncbi:MAG: T9SS type A sorting domain-containing protein [Bacteroidetes bacterium]|nr:T9SS type A sorting domain-containing protein [Bacteroidota bacterium]
MIDTNGCREQDSIYVFIRSQPDASFTYSFLAARDVQFVPSMTNYMKYKWLFGDGDSSGLVSPAHQYTAGNFSSSLKVTDMYSCEDSSSQSIFITGIGNPVTNEELDVYPNPFKDKVYIIYEGKSSQLEVIDLHGKVVKKMKIVKGMNEIDLKEYPSGIYLLRIEGGESTKILKLE